MNEVTGLKKPPAFFSGTAVTGDVGWIRCGFDSWYGRSI